jgi:hypothetical protein
MLSSLLCISTLLALNSLLIQTYTTWRRMRHFSPKRRCLSIKIDGVASWKTTWLNVTIEKRPRSVQACKLNIETFIFCTNFKIKCSIVEFRNKGNEEEDESRRRGNTEKNIIMIMMRILTKKEKLKRCMLKSSFCVLILHHAINVFGGELT